MTSTSKKITQLDLLRLRDMLADLRVEVQELARNTNTLIYRGVTKEGELGCEEVAPLLSYRTRRMRELRDALHFAEVVEMPTNPESVTLGTKVTIERDGETQEWEIVGYMQSEVEARRIAYDTPLVNMLLDKKVGDEFSDSCCGKPTSIKILAIKVANGNGKLH